MWSLQGHLPCPVMAVMVLVGLIPDCRCHVCPGSQPTQSWFLSLSVGSGTGLWPTQPTELMPGFLRKETFMLHHWSWTWKSCRLLGQWEKKLPGNGASTEQIEPKWPVLCDYILSITCIKLHHKPYKFSFCISQICLEISDTRKS